MRDLLFKDHAWDAEQDQRSTDAICCPSCGKRDVCVDVTVKVDYQGFLAAQEGGTSFSERETLSHAEELEFTCEECGFTRYSRLPSIRDCAAAFADWLVGMVALCDQWTVVSADRVRRYKTEAEAWAVCAVLRDQGEAARVDAPGRGAL